MTVELWKQSKVWSEWKRELEKRERGGRRERERRGRARQSINLIKILRWKWPRRDLNTQPSDLESDALPLRHGVRVSDSLKFQRNWTIVWKVSRKFLKLVIDSDVSFDAISMSQRASVRKHLKISFVLVDSFFKATKPTLDKGTTGIWTQDLLFTRQAH